MRPIPGTITDPAVDRILTLPTRDRTKDNPTPPAPVVPPVAVVPLEPADPQPPKPYAIGEYWLRGKLRMHRPETFHNADPQLVYAAVQSLFRELDAAREALFTEGVTA